MTCLTSSCDQRDIELDMMLKKTYNEEFNELHPDKVATSVEDDRALNIVENSVTSVDGRYQLALPLRDDYVKLPNNRDHAKQHLLHMVNNNNNGF